MTSTILYYVVNNYKDNKKIKESAFFKYDDALDRMKKVSNSTILTKDPLYKNSSIEKVVVR